MQFAFLCNIQLLLHMSLSIPLYLISPIGVRVLPCSQANVEATMVVIIATLGPEERLILTHPIGRPKSAIFSDLTARPPTPTPTHPHRNGL